MRITQYVCDVKVAGMGLSFSVGIGMCKSFAINSIGVTFLSDPLWS